MWAKKWCTFDFDVSQALQGLLEFRVLEHPDHFHVDVGLWGDSLVHVMWLWVEKRVVSFK